MITNSLIITLLFPEMIPADMQQEMIPADMQTFRRQINVDAASWRCIDVDTTLP